LLQQQNYVQALDWSIFKSKQNEVNKQHCSHWQFDQSVPYTILNTIVIKTISIEDDFFRSSKPSSALMEAHLLPELLPSSFQQRFSTFFCLGPPKSPLLLVTRQPEPALALWMIFFAFPSPL
jgi:hypothetical protein